MACTSDDIQGAIAAGRPLVYLVSADEPYVLEVLHELAAGAEPEPRALHVWSCRTGLEGVGDPASTRDPAAALAAVLETGPPGFYVFKDLADYFTRPDVRRPLRDLCLNGAGVERTTFILAPELVLPANLREDMHILELPPPSEQEIRDDIARFDAAGPLPGASANLDPELVLAMRGLSMTRIRELLARAGRAETVGKDALLSAVFDEKQTRVRQSGCLEFVPPRWDIANVGGLDNMKEWLRKRQALFTQEAYDAGMPMPRGLLVMGVSGCGKSLAVKIISALWHVPLFRLDMNLIFSGMFGTPEAAFHRALKMLETVAPVILWIDEIENGLGIEEERIRISHHVFSAFLTWMQEKPPLVFVAATANRIHALPAEIIRKGRFDQVFFVDLPNEAERHDILEIHLRRHDADPAEFDIKMLTIMLEGWNGAEIEQAVAAGRVEAYYEKRPLTMKDVTRSAQGIVPLSTTMEEQIKSIRRWAFERAAPASKHSKVRRR